MPNVLLKIAEYNKISPIPAPKLLLSVFALLFRVKLPELDIKKVSLNSEAAQPP